MSAYRARLTRVRDIAPDDWGRLFPGEAEGHAYYCLCEAAPPKAFQLSAVAVFSNERLVAAAPVFRLEYNLATSMQGSARRAADVFGRWLRVPAIALGSPLAERCHLGFMPELSAEERRAVLALMLAALEAEAQANKIGLVGVKDLAQPDHDAYWAGGAGRFAHVRSLPVAVLDIPASQEAYLAALSPSSRKDLRRKLKSSGARVEKRASIEGVEREIAALYNATRCDSALNYGEFEELPENYFAKVMTQLGGRAFLMLYWVGDELAAFNLMLRDDDRLIDKFWGMRRDLARAHHIYFVSWMANVRLCIEERIPLLQTGQTAYAAKLRLGSRLVGSHIWFRHRNRVTHFALRQAARFIAFDQMDPDLAALARKDRG